METCEQNTSQIIEKLAVVKINNEEKSNFKYCPANNVTSPINKLKNNGINISAKELKL